MKKSRRFDFITRKAARPRIVHTAAGPLDWKAVFNRLAVLRYLFTLPRELIIFVGIAVFVSTQGLPYLRINYTYCGPASHPYYTRCYYFGLMPFTEYAPAACPLIVLRKHW